MNDAGLLLLLVFARVGGLVMTAPWFSGAAMPLQARVPFAAALALLVAPSQWPGQAVPFDN